MPTDLSELENLTNRVRQQILCNYGDLSITDKYYPRSFPHSQIIPLCKQIDQKLIPLRLVKKRRKYIVSLFKSFRTQFEVVYSVVTCSVGVIQSEVGFDVVFEISCIRVGFVTLYVS